MDLIYRVGLMLMNPAALCAGLLAAAALLRKRKRAVRACLAATAALLMFCGNGWVVRGMVRRLESRIPAPDPVPPADCILILGGGIDSRIPPRPTVEVDEAGDRVLYGAYLYRRGLAPRVICTGGIATGSVALRPGADDMAELLRMIGVPGEAIITETKSANTREHARNLGPMFRERGFRRVLLVTSAMHMPRSVGVFRRLCPGVEFIPAPTDFRVTERIPVAWYRSLLDIIPTPENMMTFADAMHEYVGMEYYGARGWL
jgi:uncharacterized SAM-binding protein YcdF (DUF218 family)